jgi:hypothetical protein
LYQEKKISKLATLFDFQFYHTPVSKASILETEARLCKRIAKGLRSCPARVLKSAMRILLPELELHNTSSYYGKMPADILELPLCSDGDMA